MGVYQVFIDISGCKFGKWTAVSRAKNNKRGSSVWNCVCDCGQKRLIEGGSLRHGNTSGCPRCSSNVKPDTAFNRLFDSYKRHAKKADREFSITKEDFYKITKMPCYYCGNMPKAVSKARGGSEYIYNGIDRKNNDIGYRYDNCLPACFKCNRAKAQMDYEEFINHISRIFYHINAKDGIN